MPVLHYLLLGLLLSTAACTPQLYERGNIIAPADVDRIRVGSSSRNEVVQLLGTPTLVNAFRNERWVYIQERRYAAYRMVNRLEITFDQAGIVQDIQRNFGDQLWDPEQVVREEKPFDALDWSKLTNPGAQDITPSLGEPARARANLPAMRSATNPDGSPAAAGEQGPRWWQRLGDVVLRRGEPEPSVLPPGTESVPVRDGNAGPAWWQSSRDTGSHP
jgi:outer membrane protein assembly factor BamE (lipoprotein component of BamABCDE complex)